MKTFNFLMTPTHAQVATAWKDLRCLITNEKQLKIVTLLKQILYWGAQQLQEKAERKFQKILKPMKATD